MHRQFATAEVAARHVLDGADDARETAARILERVRAAGLLWPGDRRPGPSS